LCCARRPSAVAFTLYFALRADWGCEQAQEKASAAEAESAKMRKQVETLEADKAKLTADVAQLTKEKLEASQNWKKWSDKAKNRKDECIALQQERDGLKRVSLPPPPPPLQLIGIFQPRPHASLLCSARRFTVAHARIHAGTGAGGPQA
jgi:hypothetical protein